MKHVAMPSGSEHHCQQRPLSSFASNSVRKQPSFPAFRVHHVHVTSYASFFFFSSFFAARHTSSGAIVHFTLNDLLKSCALVGNIVGSASCVEEFVRVSLTLTGSGAPSRGRVHWLSFEISTVFVPCIALILYGQDRQCVVYIPPLSVCNAQTW